MTTQAPLASSVSRLASGLMLGFLVSLTPTVQASDSTPPYNERLLPVAQTFLDLQLCASYATEQEQDAAKGDVYSESAWTLYDGVIANGWDKQLFSSVMVVAHEQRSLLEVKDDDTPETFKRRHQTGEPCGHALSTARMYLAEGLPKP